MRVIVFGCGGVGGVVKDKLEKEGNIIIAYSDNDGGKWGKNYENCRVIEPQEIIRMEYDLVAIGVFKAAYVIRKQLIGLGVPEQKIVIPEKAPWIFHNPIPFPEEQMETLGSFEYLSQTTRDYIEKQIVVDDEEFLQKLEDLKQILKENAIPRRKVCVVGGAVLQAHGLRKSRKFDDIDIIMTSDLREIYGAGLVIVSATAEMHPQDEYKVTDDEIIEDNRYHFVFQDLKFACLEIVGKHR